MTIPEHAALFVQAMNNHFLTNFDFNGHEPSCNSECESCPARCELLSYNGTTYDFTQFKTNYEPIHDYIKIHYPELFI